MRNSRGVFVEGYRAMGYNATFEKTMVEVVDKHKAGRHIIELEDVNSGIRLMVSLEDKMKLGQEEFKRLKESYKTNEAFKKWVDSYRKVRGLSVWDALTYSTVVEKWREVNG